MTQDANEVHARATASASAGDLPSHGGGMPSPVGSYAFQVPILGAKRASYSPICGVTVGPKLDWSKADHVYKITVHERSHHFLAPTRMMLFMRQIAGVVHTVLRSFSKPPKDPTRVPIEEIVVPVPADSSLGRLDALLRKLHERTALIQEAFAVYTSTQWFAAASGLPGLRELGVDPVSYEVDSVEGTRLGGFKQFYLRYRGACASSSVLPYWLAIYALNGPYPELVAGDAEILGARSPTTREDGWAYLMDVFGSWTRTMDEEWDSPERRFTRAIEAAERLPWIAGGISEQSVLTHMVRALPDFRSALEVCLLRPQRIAHPMIGLGCEAIDRWSVRLWEEFGGKNQVVACRSGLTMPMPCIPTIQDLERTGSAGTISMYLEKLESGDVYRMHFLRGSEYDARLAVELLGFEFLFEQLKEGRGLYCLHHISESDLHPIPHTGFAKHHSLLDGLWKVVKAPAQCNWERPGCLN